MQYTFIVNDSDYLSHHGIKGQKWGVRRYQNLDGSLTSQGREHYGVGDPKPQSLTGKMPSKSSKDAPKDLVDTAMKINGGVDIFKYGYNRNRNCAFCSASYEARRRGMDVQAQEALHGVMIGKKLGYFKELYSNYKPNMTKQIIARKSGEMNVGLKDDEYDAMVEDLLKAGPNSRGQLGIYWKANHPNGWPAGGHASNYEVKDGVFYIVDPQVGQVYSGKDARKYLANACDIRLTRTDNLKLNENLVTKKYAEKATGKFDINKAAKQFYRWYDANKVVSAVNSVGVGVGGILAVSNANPGFLLIPAATLSALGVTTLGRNVTRNIASKNARIRYEELVDKWKREGRDEWYTTETESRNRRRDNVDSFGVERRF